MGWGMPDIWDLIGRPAGMDPAGGVETEEERRRRVEQAALGEPVGEVEDLTAEQPETIMAPRIVGTEDPTTMGILSDYRDWQSRMPKREEYKPSTGRNILAGIAGLMSAFGGGGAQAGAAVRQIREKPYREASENWEREGKALGEVGDLAQNISATEQRRESDVLGYEGTQARVEAQRQAIEQRREGENLRHDDRMKNLKEDSAKRAEVKRHNQELEKLAREANRIRSIEAGARKTGAEAYATRVEQQGKEQKTTKPLPPHYRQAVMDEIGAMLAADPYAQRWFMRDPRNKDQIMVKPGLKIQDPNDIQRFSTFLERAKARARQTLQIPEEDEVDEYNPLRQDIP